MCVVSRLQGQSKTYSKGRRKGDRERETCGDRARQTSKAEGGD